VLVAHQGARLFTTLPEVPPAAPWGPASATKGPSRDARTPSKTTWALPASPAAKPPPQPLLSTSSPPPLPPPATLALSPLPPLTMTLGAETAAAAAAASMRLSGALSVAAAPPWLSAAESCGAAGVACLAWAHHSFQLVAAPAAGPAQNRVPFSALKVKTGPPENGPGAAPPRHGAGGARAEGGQVGGDGQDAGRDSCFVVFELVRRESSAVLIGADAVAVLEHAPQLAGDRGASGVSVAAPLDAASPAASPAGSGVRPLGEGGFGRSDDDGEVGVSAAGPASGKGWRGEGRYRRRLIRLPAQYAATHAPIR
jgi:hypothetical protein